MSLAMLSTGDERLVGPAVQSIVRAGVADGGVQLLVPTLADALMAQKTLAELGGLSLGVSVDTPRLWACCRWEVWGDGRRVVDGPTRTLLATSVLEEASASELGTIEVTPGTVRLMGSMAQRCLPWVREALDDPVAQVALSSAERRLVRLMARYEALLDARGLVEGATVMGELPAVLARAGVALHPVVLAGFDLLAKAERELVVGLARITQVTVVHRDGEALAWRQTRSMVDELARRAEEEGVDVVWGGDSAREGLGRNPELDHLLASLFDPTAPRVGNGGAVRLLEPSGPLAEAELVAREVRALADEGLANVVVAVPDVRRAWRELVPKLVGRGVTVRAQLSVPALQTRAGAAFMGYARAVANLVDLSATWPVPVAGEDGERVRLGDMSWWPPQDLIDFLLSDVSHVEAERAWALDAQWRSNRLMSPGDVLAQLLSAKATSDAVERATRELLRGRLGSAASKLLVPFAPDKGAGSVGHVPEGTSLAREETVAVLAAVLGVAATLKELGLSADPSVPGSVGLSALVRQAELALGDVRVMLRPCVRAEHERATVQLLSRDQAAGLAPASADALVACGLTSAELAVPTGDDVLEGMLQGLGMEPPADPLDGTRASFARLCAVPRERLLLERALFSGDSKETYPAVMLTEVLSCYRQELGGTALGEQNARAMLSVAGAAPRPMSTEPVAAAGVVDVGLRRLVTVPQEGRAELPGGLPVLSASQLESYLECPLKWFSLRRLRLRDNDAGFGPLEMGTFAHRVLELTHGQLLGEARAAADASDVGLALDVPLRGSRAVADDPATVEHAREVLSKSFDLHLEHQYLRVGARTAYQALVAHTAQEEGGVERLRRDLLSVVDYEAGLLRGFEPRLFEWEFGRGGDRTSYAGVRVTGTVDRIDVNAHGQAVVIDYKHKGQAGFFGEYAALTSEGHGPDAPFALPRRIQALMYAQVVRRAFPGLQVVGALYMATRAPHELSGAVDANVSENVFGAPLGSRRAPRVEVLPGDTFGQERTHGMEALLDVTEDAIAEQVGLLRAGNIQARPVDATACSFCPVSNCERRMRA